MDKIRLDVRCCCDVTKVLGSVEIRAEFNFDGCDLGLVAEDPDFKYLCAAWDAGILPNSKARAKVLYTQVCSFRLQNVDRGLAIKSMDYPVSDWLRVPSFVINPNFTKDNA